MRDALTLWIVKAVLSPWPPRRRLYQRICGPVFDPGKPVGGWTTKLRRVNVGTTSDVSFYNFESVAGRGALYSNHHGGLMEVVFEGLVGESDILCHDRTLKHEGCGQNSESKASSQ